MEAHKYQNYLYMENFKIKRISLKILLFSIWVSTKTKPKIEIPFFQCLNNSALNFILVFANETVKILNIFIQKNL